MPRRSGTMYLDRRPRSSYGYAGERGGFGGRIGIGLVVVVVLALAVGIVQWLRPLPVQHVKRTAATSVAAPGQSTRLPWPGEGEAAAAVAGVGMIGSSGDGRPVPIASLAKMMTAYQILTDHPLALNEAGPVLVVTSGDVADYRARIAERQSALHVQEGERLSEYQALQALLIPSANNVAAMLARWDAGSQSAFVQKMNATAQRLGLKATHYDDPDGYSPSTVSNATDQLALAQAAMKLPVFASIVAQPAVTFPIAGKVFNYNYFIGHDGFIGIKTGSDSAAGGCWAFAAERTVDGKPTEVYGVVLGVHGKNGELIQPALEAGRRIANAVPQLLRRVEVVPAGTVVGYLRAPWRQQVALVTRQPLSVLTMPGQKLSTDVQLRTPRHTSVHAGTVVGRLSIGSASTDVVVAHAASGPAIGWRLTRL